MRLAALAGLMAAGAAMPAMAVPAQYDIDFVSAFADACVPLRMSYDYRRREGARGLPILPIIGVRGEL